MIVPVPQFTAPAYGDRTANNVQRAKNWFPEQTPEGWKFVSYPGYHTLGTVANNAACRGAYYASNGSLFSLNGNTLYEIASNGSSSSRGTISTSSGRVAFADNGTQLLMVIAGTNAYTVGLGGGAPTLISDGNFPSGPVGAAFSDGYFFVCKAGTGLFYLSQLLDGTDWTPVQFATAEYSGDALYGVQALGNQVYFFGTRTIEPWYNTGNASFPYERINGGTVNIGVGAFASIAKHLESAYFIGSSDAGQRPVFAIGAGGLKRISTPRIEALISRGDVYDWIGSCHNIDGHSFYALNNLTLGGSFLYDITTGQWMESVDVGTAFPITAIVNAFEGEVALGELAQAYGFSATDGKVYEIRTAYNSADGSALSRIRIFGPIASNGKRVFHRQIRIELEMAFDATGATSIAPTLDWSDDGGLTYSTAITLTKTVTNTTTGQRVVLTANRLGSSEERFYRLTGPTSAAKFILKKCELDLEEGRF